MEKFSISLNDIWTRCPSKVSQECKPIVLQMASLTVFHFPAEKEQNNSFDGGVLKREWRKWKMVQPFPPQLFLRHCEIMRERAISKKDHLGSPRMYCWTKKNTDL
ncbi:hypothetical protein CDAR_577031 [Caerostris darwini]|uniref:Uncharacterized protein n=1 Tax=Caerostris darwini TaxID=1538125 RepID=A0AAV4RFD7_9ARAC|nr:hypothetical protein CDAR_577031 [Caerostris darwini]